MVFSSDEGKTWTKPIVVVDSPADDRNPALGQAKDGTLVVGYWRTATYKILTVNYATGSKEHPEWGVHCGAVTISAP